MKITVWIDGGCRHNGSPDAEGYASVRIKGRQDKVYRDDLPAAKTNQQAEWAALLMALDLLAPMKEYPGNKVEIRTDSMNVYGGVELNYKIKADQLVIYRALCLDEILDFLKNGVEVTLVKVDRTEIVEELGH